LIEFPPTELVAFDFDGTLLRSPESPDGDPMWWFHAYSLDAVRGGPGLDHHWVVPAIIHARRASLRPSVMTVVLTARPDHKGMRQQIHRLVSLTGIDFDAVQLKPVVFPGSDPLYKAGAVIAWLERHPSIRRVTLYDDIDANLSTVGQAVQQSGREYVAVKGPGL
jgi:hypothetical protein